MKDYLEIDVLRPVEIMGIVNVTGDSFYAPSRHLSGDGKPDVGKVLGTVEKMLSEGASMIDIGACSSRQGAEIVPEDIEWKRLRPVLEAIKAEFPEAALSIDTTRSGIVRRAFDIVGKFTVNDISAGEDDPEMLRTVGNLGLPYIAMHMKGTPRTMQEHCNYEDVVAEVLEYFEKFALKALDAGIHEWIVDPGFGFAKTVEQNYRLLENLGEFKRPLGGVQHRVLVGISRKRMAYEPLGTTPEESLAATQELHLKALQNGADILRVHDVAPALATLSKYRHASF